MPSLAGGDATDPATIAYLLSVALTKKKEEEEASRAEKEQVKAAKKLDAKGWRSGSSWLTSAPARPTFQHPNQHHHLDATSWWLFIVFFFGEEEEEEEEEEKDKKKKKKRRRRSPCSLAASCSVSLVSPEET